MPKPLRTSRLALPLAWFAALLGLAVQPGPATALDLTPLRAESLPAFTADVAVSVDSAGVSALGVSVSIPYPDLQWLRLDGGYAAAIEVTVVFQPHGRGVSFGDSWQRSIAVERFEQTTQRGGAVLERRRLVVPPGRYQLRVRVHDLNSERESEARERVDVPDYSRVPLAIAGLEMGRVTPGDGFELRPSRRYGMDSDQLAARVTLVDRRPGPWPRTYTFDYRVLDETGTELASGRRTPTAGHMGAPVILRPDSAALFVGTYTFEATLQDGKGRWRVERAFEVEESGPPRGREFRRMLEPLSYIAGAEEYDILSHLQDAEQAAGWETFWKRRDPTPDTPRNEALLEFMRRVRYSEEHFQHYGPAWRSDMGRIYIKFGAPDQTETRPATSQSPQLEVWFYNQPYRQFVFADRDGFGRYVLVSPGIE